MREKDLHLIFDERQKKMATLEDDEFVSKWATTTNRYSRKMSILDTDRALLMHKPEDEVPMKTMDMSQY